MSDRLVIKKRGDDGYKTFSIRIKNETVIVLRVKIPVLNNKRMLLGNIAKLTVLFSQKNMNIPMLLSQEQQIKDLAITGC